MRTLPNGPITLALLVLALAIAILVPWFAVAIAVAAFLTIPSTVRNAATANAARHGFGAIPLDRLARVDRVTVDHRRTRAGTVGHAQLRSIDVVLADDAPVGIFGYCGTILRIDGNTHVLAGGAAALARGIETARRALRLASLARMTTATMMILTPVLVLLGTPLAILPAIVAIVLGGVVTAFVSDDRRFEEHGMTRLQRRVTRRFETMFRGI